MAIKISGSTIIDDSRNIVSAGVVTATSFSGSGSSLTNIGYASSAGISSYTSEWILGANGSTDYTFTGPGFDAATNDPTLFLIRGQQYKFTNTMGAHPFRIQSTPNGSVGTSYNNGIVNNDVSNGTLTWNVQFNAPGILYYQCISHPSMGGKIYIVDAGIGTDVSVNTTGVITATAFVGDGSGLTGIVAADSGVVVQEEGSNVGTATTFNFVGAGVTATYASGTATITISGSGGGGGSSVGTGITLGTPSDGSLSADGALLGWTPTTTVTDALDELNEILGKLAPAKPSNLSTFTLSMQTAQYTAIESSTGATRTSSVLQVTTPRTNDVTQFYDGDSGTLEAYVDGALAPSSSRVLTTASDVGNFGALRITADAGFPVSGNGANFWKSLTAYIQPASALSVGIHTFQMRHSTTGNTNNLTFYVDDPGTVTITSTSGSVTGSATAYRSGVPTLTSGTTFTVNFTVNNAIRQFYNSSRIADITGNSVLSSTVNHSISGTQTNGAAVSVVDKVCTVGSSKYVESGSSTVTVTGYNSAGNAGTGVGIALTARIDTVSTETRLRSGSGDFPSGTAPTNYGGVYDSTQSLKAVGYTEEMQIVNGQWKYPPAVNYATNLPISGPDYSSGMGTNDRWVLFNGGTLSAASGFTLVFNGSSGFGSTPIVSGMKIVAKVEGVTGWIDCNAAYSGVGQPSTDGTGAMVIASSTATSHRITFGTTRSGTLYVRIGFPAGSTKYFTSITVTPF